jgi:hypothetical protein
MNGRNKLNKIRFFFFLNRIRKIFIFSCIWLSFPILIFYLPKIKSEITYYKSFLTPYSVTVNGYSRTDGTIIKSYKRRPPGSVSHDKPFKREIKKLEVKIKIIYIIFIVSILVFVFYLYIEVISFKKTFDNYIHIQIVSKIHFDFNVLSNKPPNVINRLISRHSISKTYYCIYCKRLIRNDEFHHSNLSKHGPKKTCLNCMVKMELKFMHELKYINNFNYSLTLFFTKYKEISKSNFDGYEIKKSSIEKYFFEKVKENRMKIGI